MRRLAAVLLAAIIPATFELHADGRALRLDFSEDEIARILQHGPWPPPLTPDPSNRVSGKPEAIALGEKLFFEPRLSGSGSILCATCHAPFRHFQDARARAFGLELVDRNTPTVINARFHRWYGWDGERDSLWAQSIRPLLDPREMDASAAHVANTVKALFRADYEKAFGRPPPPNAEELLADTGKALAAFQETLVSPRSAFDEFRDALAKGREADYPLDAQRGLRIFVGKGGCNACHFGPLFTDGEFADTGVDRFAVPDRVDAGRQAGIDKRKSSPFSLLGRFNDDPSKANAGGTRHVQAQQRKFGEFRVPGLRAVARTAPYMHNGSLATLRDVVRFYSQLDAELRLTEREVDDLVAFLETL